MPARHLEGPAARKAPRGCLWNDVPEQCGAPSDHVGIAGLPGAINNRISISRDHLCTRRD